MKFINWFDGKKTILGGISTAMVIFLVAKGWIDAETATLIGSITGLLLATGVGHKIQKARKED